MKDKNVTGRWYDMFKLPKPRLKKAIIINDGEILPLIDGFTGEILKVKNMTDYNCIFQVVIRQKSLDGIDLEEYRMDEICQKIGKILVDEFPNLGVFSLGFEVVK